MLPARAETELVDRVLAAIDEESVVALALTLGGIDSAAGHELEAVDYVFDWMKEEGFAPRRVGLVPERTNVVGRLKGTGGGCSILFNSHLDTSVAADEWLSTSHAADRVYHDAWREGDVLVGNGVCNDKGQMACWMIAARAIRKVAGPLPGDIVLTSVCGEIELEPIDEFAAPTYSSREFGTRYVITRGAIADYALVAEATDFRLGSVEAGNLFLKLNVYGQEPPVYNPFVDRESGGPSPNAIVLLAGVIQKLEPWALEYERRNRWESPGGTVVPKLSIGAIRSGLPYKISKTAQVAAAYLDVRLNPAQDPLDVLEELTAFINCVGVEFDLEIYTYRPGRAARGLGTLNAAVATAHRRVFGGAVEKALPTTTSLWRDLNSFAESGIPCVMYGPGPNIGTGNFTIKVADLVDAARAYALIALEICSTPRSERQRDGSTG